MRLSATPIEADVRADGWQSCAMTLLIPSLDTASRWDLLGKAARMHSGERYVGRVFLTESYWSEGRQDWLFGALFTGPFFVSSETLEGDVILEVES